MSPRLLFELELELIQTQLAQKQMLRVEEGARALRNFTFVSLGLVMLQSFGGNEHTGSEGTRDMLSNILIARVICL